MVRRIIGYILSIAGVLGLAIISFPQVRDQIPEQITTLGTTTILIASVVLIALGIFLLIRAGTTSQKSKEVPIYRGKNIVGYRRD